LRDIKPGRQERRRENASRVTNEKRLISNRYGSFNPDVAQNR
jgi:hypothetical protein